MKNRKNNEDIMQILFLGDYNYMNMAVSHTFNMNNIEISFIDDFEIAYQNAELEEKVSA